MLLLLLLSNQILELHKKTVRSIISANEDEAIEDLMRSKFGEVPVLPGYTF
jgi:hypothetical protein